jgi:hypothetical protein
VTEIPHSLQIKARVTVEVKGADKPSLLADSLVRFYT